MDRRMMLLVIGLVFGGGIGFLVAASNGVTLDGHDHASVHGGGHDHAALTAVSVSAGATAPTLTATVQKDPMSGWNLQLAVTNFEFAPQNASLAHKDGEGHAHVYVNGEKIARLYGTWMHIATLPDGDVIVSVELNTNDHRPLAVDGAPVRVELTVDTAD